MFGGGFVRSGIGDDIVRGKPRQICVEKRNESNRDLYIQARKD